MSPAAVLARAGGRASWAELLRHTTRHRIRRALAAGEIIRVARGVYALPTVPAARLAAARAGGALCLESAAISWGLPVLGRPGSTPLRIAVRPNARRPPAADAVYRWCRLSDEELAEGRTGLLRTVLDCAAVLPFARALTVADSVLREGHYDRAELLRAAQALRGAGRARRLHVLRLADGRAENPFESLVRAVLLEAGITGFVPQVLIRVPGFAAQVDLADQRLRIVIEAEGFAYHGATARAFDRDVGRYSELVAHGWLVLRFTWQHVHAKPGWVVEKVRATQARATRKAHVPSPPARPGTIRQQG